MADSSTQFKSVAGPAAPIRVMSAHRSCIACPAQWDGRTDDGRLVYARYRGSHGYVSVAPAGDESEFAALPPTGSVVVEFERINEDPQRAGWDGWMEESVLVAITAPFVTWPEVEPHPQADEYNAERFVTPISVRGASPE